jgi:hypothetical protein
MMIFLGAQASKRFGIKTIEVLSREFENSLEPIKDKIKPIEGEFSEEEVFEERNKKLSKV